MLQRWFLLFGLGILFLSISLMSTAVEVPVVPQPAPTTNVPKAEASAPAPSVTSDDAKLQPPVFSANPEIGPSRRIVAPPSGTTDNNGQEKAAPVAPIKKEVQRCTKEILELPKIDETEAVTPKTSDKSEKVTEYLSINQVRINAELGLPSAQFRLGTYYVNGVGNKNAGISGNRKVMLNWWLRAACNDNGQAAEALSEGFSNESYGIGTDGALSFAWLRVAAELGQTSAQYSFGQKLLELNGAPAPDGLESTPDDPKTKPFYWVKLAAEGGNIEAQFQLGLYYQNGFGTVKNLDEAIKWYQKVAEIGDHRGILREGVIHNYGLNGKPDNKKGMELMEKAADLGNYEAYYNIADSYLHGIGVPRNPSKAYIYYRKCAEGQIETCMNIMAYAYLNGVRGVIQRDPEQALYWYRTMTNANIGSATGFNAVSLLYEKGYGSVRKNLYLAYIFKQFQASNNEFETMRYANNLYRRLTTEQQNKANKFFREWKVGTPFPTE